MDLRASHRAEQHAEHQAAVARRFALLGDELAAVRGAVAEGVADPDVRPWWDGHTRPAGAARTAPAVPAVLALPGGVPVPGRHAARRASGAPWTAGPARGILGPPQLAVVAVLVAVALAVTGWWLLRSGPASAQLQAAPAGGLVGLASPSSGATTATTTATTAATTTATTAGSTGRSAPAASPSTVTVDVAGRVRHPGLQVLEAGARVADALDAAGGPRPGIDLTGLNLARVVSDGEQILVGERVSPASPSQPDPPAPSASTPGPVALVHLNTATAEQLDTLPDVGPVTAASILSWRDAHGGFTSVDELLEVDGIGEVTLGRIAPYVTL